MAKDFNIRLNFDDRSLFRGLDRTEKALDSISDESKKLDKTLDRTFDDNHIRNFNAQLKKSQGNIDLNIGFLSKLASIASVAFTTIAIGDFVKDSAQAAINSEQLFVSFETFLGSAEKATEVLADLNQFSLKTPFTPDQVNEAGKALIAFGITQDKLLPTLKSVG